MLFSRCTTDTENLRGPRRFLSTARVIDFAVEPRCGFAACFFALFFVMSAGCGTSAWQECETDAQCEQGYMCVSGFCQWVGITCDDDLDCRQGEICSGGICQESCRGDFDCQSGFRCESGRCVPEGQPDGGQPDGGQPDGDPGGDPGLQCAQTSDCPDDYYCEQGHCAPAQGACVEPEPEVCDGVDNDCDDVTDNGFGVGESCTAEGECATGVATGVIECFSPTEAVCSTAPGGSQDRSRPELCNGLDDDCDGDSDEDFSDLGSACTVGEGTCALTGIYECAPDGYGQVCATGEPPCPSFSDPQPAYPPQTWSASRTVFIGATAQDPDGVDATGVEYRIDANGDGDYDDAAGFPEEDWTSAGLQAPQSGPSVSFEIEVGYSADSAPERFLAFEFRASDSLGNGPAYSGESGEEDISDDWYALADETPPDFSPALSTDRITDKAVKLVWDAAAREDNFAGYEVFYDAAGPPDVGGSPKWDMSNDPNLSDMDAGGTTVRNLSNLTTYYFAARAVDAAGNASPLCDPVSATTLEVAPLPFYDFNACDEGWVTGGEKSTWECGAPTSGPGDDHEGGGSLWATNLDGAYEWHENSYLESPEIDMSVYQGIHMRFWHWCDFEDEFGGRYPDGGAIFAFDGTDWVQVTPEGGYNGEISARGSTLEGLQGFTNAGPQKQWVEETVDFSAFDNPDFKVRFHFASDISVEQDGWYIDDVLFEEVP